MATKPTIPHVRKYSMSHDPNNPNHPQDTNPGATAWTLLPALLIVCLAVYGGYQLAAYVFGG